MIASSPVLGTRGTRGQGPERVLWEEEGELVFSVQDDGKGFDVESVLSDYDRGNSFGLSNMRERAELIGGVLTLESGSKREKLGTLVQLRVALPSPDKPERKSQELVRVLYKKRRSHWVGPTAKE